MRVFVSSSFEDLQEYRIAAIRALRQLGHEVVAMEDFVAASGVPLKQMLDKVERCNLYIGLFACWVRSDRASKSHRAGSIWAGRYPGAEQPQVPAPGSYEECDDGFALADQQQSRREIQRPDS